MKMIYFKIDILLDKLNVTANHVARESKVAPHTVAAYKYNTVKRIERDALDAIINTLNEISIEKGMGEITIEDVIGLK